MSLSLAPPGSCGVTNGYWGQNGGLRLRAACDTGVNFVTLAWVNRAPEHDESGYPGTNFGPWCWSTSYSNYDGISSHLLDHCETIKQDIPYCQQKGVKVLISIGGTYDQVESNYQVSTEENGVAFADFMYKAFGPYDSAWDGPRPFDKSKNEHVAVDGFDFNILHKLDNKPYIAMVEQLRQLDSSLRITASPACINANGNYDMKEMIQMAAFDALFIQFYHNPRCEYNGGSFNYDDWERALDASAKNRNAKIFVGLPASQESGYLTPEQLKGLISKYGSRRHFGGLSLWDLAKGNSNKIGGKPYNELALGLLKEACSTMTVSTSTSSSSSTTAMTTSTLVTTTSSTVLTSSTTTSNTSPTWSTSTSALSTASSTSYTPSTSSTSSSMVTSSSLQISSTETNTPSTTSTLEDSSTVSSLSLEVSSSATETSTTSSSSTSQPTSSSTPSSPTSTSFSSSSSSSTSVPSSSSSSTSYPTSDPEASTSAASSTSARPFEITTTTDSSTASLTTDSPASPATESTSSPASLSNTTTLATATLSLSNAASTSTTESAMHSTTPHSESIKPPEKPSTTEVSSAAKQSPASSRISTMSVVGVASAGVETRTSTSTSLNTATDTATEPVTNEPPIATSLKTTVMPPAATSSTTGSDGNNQGSAGSSQTTPVVTAGASSMRACLSGLMAMMAAQFLL